ncbi:unnamed protein product [Trifolium pratense]|uniref:Uncharacterized protein n=1 Tax=Trifolium pratense TaxID=57577 RepID=A0ACB0LDT9_TRIPR|nr:unnamed protein product [Trifolium pratense]
MKREMKKRFLLRTIFGENETTEFENDFAAFNFQPFRWNGTLKLVNPSANASSTLSPALEPCRVAEFRLSEAAGLTNFGLVILRLVTEPDEQIESSIDEQIRLAAAVNFKNHLHLRWSSEDNPITESEKEQIKTLIVPLMLSATAKIQSQLRETVAIIADGFAHAVWTLLQIVLQSTSRDQLAITAIKFLTTVSTGPHHTLFAADGIIPQICQGIVIPVVMLREDDEEQFVMNHIEYIRRDMEGSDLDTRRRIACELLKGITKYYGDVVRHIVSTQIQSLLSSYAANPAVNWKHKDCAIYLVVSLSNKKAGTKQDRVEDQADIPDIPENVGYTATFVRLQNAGKNKEDPLKEIRYPQEFFIASLSRLCAHSPGRYPKIIGENVDPMNQAALL